MSSNIKLDMKRLALYYPYDLMIAPYESFGIRKMCCDSGPEHVRIDAVVNLQMKPLLISISKLEQNFFQEVFGWKYDLTLEELKNRLYTNRIGFYDMLYLIENHYDVFGLIERGLAEEKPKLYNNIDPNKRGSYNSPM